MSKLLLVFVVITISAVSFSNVFGNNSQNLSTESIGLNCEVNIECKRFWVDTPLCGKGVYTEDGNVVLILVGKDCNGERIHRYNTIWYMIALCSHIPLHQCRDRFKCKVPEKYLRPRGDRKFVVVVTERNIARHIEIKLKYIKERKLRIHGSTNGDNENYKKTKGKHHKTYDDKIHTENESGTRKHGNENHNKKQKKQHKKEDDKGRSDRKVVNVNHNKTEEKRHKKDDNKVPKDSELRGSTKYINTDEIRHKKDDNDMLRTYGDTQDGNRKSTTIQYANDNNDIRYSIYIKPEYPANRQTNDKQHTETIDKLLNRKSSNNSSSGFETRSITLYNGKYIKNIDSHKSKKITENLIQNLDALLSHLNAPEQEELNIDESTEENDFNLIPRPPVLLVDSFQPKRPPPLQNKRIHRPKYLSRHLPKSRIMFKNNKQNYTNDSQQYPDSKTVHGDIHSISDGNATNVLESLTNNHNTQGNDVLSKKNTPTSTLDFRKEIVDIPSDYKKKDSQRLLNLKKPYYNLNTYIDSSRTDQVPSEQPAVQDQRVDNSTNIGAIYHGILNKNRTSWHGKYVKVPKHQLYKLKNVLLRRKQHAALKRKLRYKLMSNYIKNTKKKLKEKDQVLKQRELSHARKVDDMKKLLMIQNSSNGEKARKKDKELKEKVKDLDVKAKELREKESHVQKLKERDQKLKQKELSDAKKVDDMKKLLMIQNSSNGEKARKKDKELKEKVKDLDVKAKELREKESHVQKLKERDQKLKQRELSHAKKVDDMKKILMIQNSRNGEKARKKDKELKEKVKDLDVKAKELREKESHVQKLKERDQKLKQRELSHAKKVDVMKKLLMIQNSSNGETARKKDEELKEKVKDLDVKTNELRDKESLVQKLKEKYEELKERGKLSKNLETQIGISSVRQKVSIPVAPATDLTLGNEMENGKELIKEVQHQKILGYVQYPSVSSKLIETAGFKKSEVQNARQLINEEMKTSSDNDFVDERTGNRLYPQNHHGIRKYVLSQPEIRIPLNSHHFIHTNPEELKQHENIYFHKQIHEDASSLKDRLNCNKSPKIDDKIESALSSIEGNIYRILAGKTRVKNINKLQKQVHEATFTIIADSLNKSCRHQLIVDERIGELKNWGSWGNCSVYCGEGGFQLRKRSCSTNRCVGSLWDVKQCSKHKPCQANWMKWSSWGPCSSSCDKGYTTRTRVCVSQVKKKKCSGNFIKIQSCNTHHCQLNNWKEWSSWSGCSVSCGTGFQERLRDCKLQAQSINSLPPCEGSSYEHRLCVHSSCSGGNGAILDRISKFQSAAMICDRATRERSNYVIWKTPDTNLITSKTETDRIKISGPYLIIHNLKESDRGLYKCALLSKLPYTKSTNDCRSHLCLNGGQCIEQSHIGVSKPLFVCICKSGYGGVYCTEESGSRRAHIIGIVFLVIILGIAKVLVVFFCCKCRKSIDFKKWKEKTNEDGTKKSCVKRLKSVFCKKPEDKVDVKMTKVKSKKRSKTESVSKVEEEKLSETMLTTETDPSVKKGQSSASQKTLFGVRSSIKDDINNLLDGVTEAIKNRSTNIRSSKAKQVKTTGGSLDNIFQGVKQYIPGTSKETVSRSNSRTATTNSSISISDFSTSMKSISVDSNSDAAVSNINDTDDTENIENKSATGAHHSLGDTNYYPAVEATRVTTDKKADNKSKKTSEDLTNYLLDHARVILSSGTNLSSAKVDPSIKSDNPNIQLHSSLSKGDAFGKKPEKLYYSKENMNASYRSIESMGNAIRSLESIEMGTTGDYVLKSSDSNVENKKVYEVTPHPKMLPKKSLTSNAKETNQPDISKKSVADYGYKSDAARIQNTQVKTIGSSDAVNEEARLTDSETSDGVMYKVVRPVSHNRNKREIPSRLDILNDEFKKIDDTVHCNTHKTSVFIETLNKNSQEIVSCEHGFIPMVLDDELFSICCREHHLRILDLLDGYTAGYSEGHHEKSKDLFNFENSTLPSPTKDIMSQPPMEEAKSMHISGHDKESIISMDDFLLKSITITPSTSGGSVESKKSYQTSSWSKLMLSGMSPQRTDKAELYSAPLASSQSSRSFISTPLVGNFVLKSNTVTPSTSVCTVENKKSYKVSSCSRTSLSGNDEADLFSTSLASSHSSDFYNAQSAPSQFGGTRNSTIVTDTEVNYHSHARINRSNNWDVCELEVDEQIDNEMEEDFKILKKIDPQLLSQFQTVSTPKTADKISLISQEPSLDKQEINDIYNVSLRSMPDIDESQYFNPIENISQDPQNTTKSTDNGSIYMSLLSATDKDPSSVKGGTRRDRGEESVDLSDINYTFSPEATERGSSITHSGLPEKTPRFATMNPYPIKHDNPEISSSLSKQIRSNSKTSIISNSDSQLESNSQGFVANSLDPILNSVKLNMDVCTVQDKVNSCSRSDQLTSDSNGTCCNNATENPKAYSTASNSVDISFSTFITADTNLNVPHSNSSLHSDNNSSVQTVGSVKRLSPLFMSPDLTPVSTLKLNKSSGEQNLSPLKIEKSSQIHSINIFPWNASDNTSTDPLHESILVKSVSVTEICTKYSQYIRPNTGESTANSGFGEEIIFPERELTETNKYFPYTIKESPLQNYENNSMYSLDDTPMSLPFATNKTGEQALFSSVRIPKSCVAKVSLEKSCDVTGADDDFNMNKFKRIMCPIPEEEDSLDESVDFKSPYTSTTEFESVIDSGSNTLRPSASDFKSPCPSEHWLVKEKGEGNDKVPDKSWLSTESNNSCLYDGNESSSSCIWSSFHQDEDKPDS